jgi:hypothetical protein
LSRISGYGISARPYHQDSALYPFIDQLGRASGFAHDDPPAAKLEKLEALLARAAPPDEDMAFLASLRAAWTKVISRVMAAYLHERENRP